MEFRSLQHLEKFIRENTSDGRYQLDNNWRPLLEYAVQYSKDSRPFLCLAQQYYNNCLYLYAWEVLQKCPNCNNEDKEQYRFLFALILVKTPHLAKELERLNLAYQKNEDDLEILKYLIEINIYLRDTDKALFNIENLWKKEGLIDKRIADLALKIYADWPDIKNYPYIIEKLKEFFEININYLDNTRETNGILKSFYKTSAIEYQKELQRNFKDHEVKIWKKPRSDVKYIILYSSHGYGDTIMFSCYLFELIKTLPSARIYLVLKEPLYPLYKEYYKHKNNIQCLLEQNILGIQNTIPVDEPIWVQELSGITAYFYLNKKDVDKKFIAPSIAKDCFYHINKPKICLLWSSMDSSIGKDLHVHKRNLSIEHLWHLREFKNKVQFISFSYNVSNEERDGVVDMLDAIDIGNNINNFKDVADYIYHSDLFISVDSAYLHLAGSMDKEVWGLIRYEHEWRWERNSQQNKWYPSLRRFNETISRGWNYVMQDVKHALNQWLEHKEKSGQQPPPMDKH